MLTSFKTVTYFSAETSIHIILLQDMPVRKYQSKGNDRQTDRTTLHNSIN